MGSHYNGFLWLFVVSLQVSLLTFMPLVAWWDISVISGAQSTPGISILLKASKTDPFHSGTIINIFQTGGITCPVNDLNIFITRCDSFSVDPEGPLFLLTSGRTVTRALFLDMLGQLCTSLGLDPKSYHGHSFRIGAATTATKLNVLSM